MNPHYATARPKIKPKTAGRRTARCRPYPFSTGECPPGAGSCYNAGEGRGKRCPRGPHVYALRTAGLIIGLSLVAAVIINYVKRENMKGSWLESRCRRQIRTFRFGLLRGAVGVLTYFFLVGYFILMAACILLVYPMAKGWISLSEGKPLGR